MLSLRIMQRQGFEVDALNVRTVFSCCRATAAQVAAAMGARLSVASVGDDYLDVIRNPSYGHGKGVNPCVDCRIYMCRMAARFMEEVGAEVAVTGEILAQRPMSQKRHQLDLIARCSGLEGRLLRPLSAKLLPPTIVETQGLVDRDKLYDFSGRSRRELIELAAELDLPDVPSPSTGCALTEVSFAPRVRDLMEHDRAATRWDFELLNYGRHVRFDPCTKIVVGRNESENAALRSMASREDASESALMVPEDFRGPEALVVGQLSEVALELAGALISRYSRADKTAGQIRVTRSTGQQVIPAPFGGLAESVETL